MINITDRIIHETKSGSNEPILKYQQTEDNTYFQTYPFGNNGIEAKCNVCGKILSDKDTYQFFPEDGSYFCNKCQKKYLERIENIKTLS